MCERRHRHISSIGSPEELEPRLREALERDPCVEVARTALRWTYRYFREYAIPFDLVREEPEYEVSLAYSDVEPLMPGAHAVLDATCALLAGDTTSLFDDPSESERARTSADEDRFISRWLQRILLRGKGPAPTLA